MVESAASNRTLATLKSQNILCRLFRRGAWMRFIANNFLRTSSSLSRLVELVFQLSNISPTTKEWASPFVNCVKKFRARSGITLVNYPLIHRRRYQRPAIKHFRGGPCTLRYRHLHSSIPWCCPMITMEPVEGTVDYSHTVSVPWFLLCWGCCASIQIGHVSVALILWFPKLPPITDGASLYELGGFKTLSQR